MKGLGRLLSRLSRLEKAIRPDAPAWENLILPVEQLRPCPLIDWPRYRAPRPPYDPAECPIEARIADLEAMAVPPEQRLTDRPRPLTLE